MKKIFMLDTETGEMTAVGAEEKCAIRSALSRVEDELTDHNMYVKMFEVDATDTRYSIAAGQEFTHMLFALADLHTALKKRFIGTPHGEELTQFFKATN